MLFSEPNIEKMSNIFKLYLHTILLFFLLKMSRFVHIAKYSFWAPGLEAAEDLAAFARGDKDVSRVSAVPALPFVPMLMRRRLSDVTRMAVYVNHFVSEGLPEAKITFASEFGEVRQQLKISEHLIETDTVTPAAFSLSVFNAPVSCATIVEKNMAGYSAAYAGAASFLNGLKDCADALSTGEGDERIFLFSDELVPETYASVVDGYPNVPCAMALRLSSTKQPGCIDLDIDEIPETHFAAEQALWLLKKILVENA